MVTHIVLTDYAALLIEIDTRRPATSNIFTSLSIVNLSYRPLIMSFRIGCVVFNLLAASAWVRLVSFTHFLIAIINSERNFRFSASGRVKSAKILPSVGVVCLLFIFISEYAVRHVTVV